MHCAVLSQEEDKLRGSALTIGRTYQIHTGMEQSQIQSAMLQKNMANLFGHRWVREHLPLLQERQKWFDFRRNMLVTLGILWIPMLRQVPGRLQMCTKQ